MDTKTECVTDREKTLKWSLTTDEKKKYITALSVCLKELREFSRMTQGELAEVAGVSRQTYGSIELKKREMSWNTYMSLIFFFDYNPRTHGIIRKKRLFYSDFDNSKAYETQFIENQIGNMKGRNLFDDICAILSLKCISELRFQSNTKRAIAALRIMNLRKYPISMLSDMANYLAGHIEQFDNYESAVAFFKGIDDEK